ncbi:hypothetical protein NDU88_003448 [Pleurodeles waltl]|uniref:Uncharacterized protein n=1 Tax=Pleurodeles waltl TaxID=8319 RepID=A0AAV7UC39_PLEWA|nr:hypothetical protein NDU88_003448 [Pleurodeles waltl]
MGSLSLLFQRRSRSPGSPRFRAFPGQSRRSAPHLRRSSPEASATLPCSRLGPVQLVASRRDQPGKRSTPHTPVGPVHRAGPEALWTQAAVQDERERERTGAPGTEAPEEQRSSPNRCGPGCYYEVAGVGYVSTRTTWDRSRSKEKKVRNPGQGQGQGLCRHCCVDGACDRPLRLCRVKVTGACGDRHSPD